MLFLSVCQFALYLFSFRLKNQKKAVVTAVDKKIPNGILEEQGTGLKLHTVRGCKAEFRQLDKMAIRSKYKDIYTIRYFDFGKRHSDSRTYSGSKSLSACMETHK